MTRFERFIMWLIEWIGGIALAVIFIILLVYFGLPLDRMSFK